MSVRRLAVATSLGLALVIQACSAPSPPSDSDSWSLQSEQKRIAGRMEVRRVLRDLEIAMSTSNLPAVASLYASDAIAAPAEGPLVRGRDDILLACEFLFAEQEVKVVLTDESVGITENAAQVLGWAGVTQTPRMGGEPVREIFRYRLVLDRGADLDRERAWTIRYVHWWPWEDLDDLDDLDQGPESLPHPALEEVLEEAEAAPDAAEEDPTGSLDQALTAPL